MKYKLNECNIDAVCSEADAFLIKRKTESGDRIQTRISIEEVLLCYMGALGNDTEFRVDYGVGFSKTEIRLTVPGKRLDPFSLPGSISEDEMLLANVLSRMGQRFRWKYSNGVNTIIYTPAKKRMPDWEKLLIAIIAAAALGLIVRMLPENISMMLQKEVVAPLLQTFLGFLNAVAGPMILLSIISGIYSIGDASTFSDVGRRMCIRFVLYLSIITTLIAIISLPFFTLKKGNSQSGNQYSELYRMMLDIVPDNLFTPLSQSNTLQIMFIGIVVGITMLITGRDIQVIAELAEQMGFVVDGIMSSISRLVHIFIFGSIFNIIASSNLASFAAGGKYFAGTLAGCIIVILIHTIIAGMSLQITPPELWKRTFSTFIIALTTASSTAAFAENRKTCIEKLGVSSRLANFGVPLGQLLYGPGTTVLFWFAAVSTAESSGTEVSMIWYITAIALCLVLSSASPTVPGGVTASFTILFTQLGLPVSELAVILPLTSILDFVMTATDVFGRQCSLAIIAGRIERKQEAETVSIVRTEQETHMEEC